MWLQGFVAVHQIESKRGQAEHDRPLDRLCDTELVVIFDQESSGEYRRLSRRATSRVKYTRM
jgi:hypothetical protein